MLLTETASSSAKTTLSANRLTFSFGKTDTLTGEIASLSTQTGTCFTGVASSRSSQTSRSVKAALRLGRIGTSCPEATSSAGKTGISFRKAATRADKITSSSERTGSCFGQIALLRTYPFLPIFPWGTFEAFLVLGRKMLGIREK